MPESDGSFLDTERGEGGTSGPGSYGTAGYAGSHRGDGRHPWSPGRSLRGARTTPLAETAQPPVPGPHDPPDPTPPGSRGINPA
jgi:hypothetical protein